MTIDVNVKNSPYKIFLERGLLHNINRVIDEGYKTLIITDDGVPEEYARLVKDACKDAKIVTIPQGEASKCFDTYRMLVNEAVSYGLTRTDRIIAVGGGVVGDLSGFVAATYMRGIQFINVPTTLLSQVDSSIGGKTAIDVLGVKNILGAFHQPSMVIIDPDTLDTLDSRQLKAGLAESIKMGATGSEKLFALIEETDDLSRDLEKIIELSLEYKRDVVEEDPNEKGLRKVLNFGHTIGHAYEAASNGALLHGEAVALGSLSLCSPSVRDRLIAVYKKHGLPTTLPQNTVINDDSLINLIKKDKKAAGATLSCVWVDKIGTFEFKSFSAEALISLRL